MIFVISKSRVLLNNFTHLGYIFLKPTDILSIACHQHQENQDSHSQEYQNEYLVEMKTTTGDFNTQNIISFLTAVIMSGNTRTEEGAEVADEVPVSYTIFFEGMNFLRACCEIYQ